jgi:hypothetical protein
VVSSGVFTELEARVAAVTGPAGMLLRKISTPFT